MVAAVVGVAAMGSAISGFGFALVSVPLLALVVGPREAVAVSTLAGLVTTVANFVSDRRHADWRRVGWLTAPALVGMPLGLAVAESIDERVLIGVIGVVVLALTVVLARRPALPRLPHAVVVGAGFVSGLLNTTTGTNGPPLVLVLQAQGLDPKRFRGTISAVFLACNAVTLVLFSAAGRFDADVRAATAVALPPLVLGWGVGLVIGKRVSADRFRFVVLGLLVVAGVSALARALIG